MTQSLFMDKYPIYSIIINKKETTFSTVDAIITYLQTKIAAHPFAIEIAIFDHLAHTLTVEDHVIDENIKSAKNLLFCFGKQLPTSKMLAVRPRSIGVCEFEESFEVNFLEVPNEKLQIVTRQWVESIKNI
jgi:hypothetical protein